jgi:hypothetical protein
MKTIELSTCFVTKNVDACRNYYERYFSAKATFDCGWYVNIRIAGNGPSIQFMQPQEDMPEFNGKCFPGTLLAVSQGRCLLTFASSIRKRARYVPFYHYRGKQCRGNRE